MFGSELLLIATGLPTVAYTVLFLVCLVYWLLVAVGMMDMPGLVGGELDGSAKGVLEGSAKGILEGSAKGILEGSAKGVLEGASAASRAPAAHEQPKPPMTLWLTVGSGFAWMLTCLAISALGGSGAEPLWQWLSALLALPVAVAMAYPLVLPLGRMITLNRGRSAHSLVGQFAEVTTGRVDLAFGQARVESQGADMLVQVRAPADRGIVRGERVLLLFFDEQAGAFDVEVMNRGPKDADLASYDAASEADVAGAARGEAMRR